MQRHWRTSRTNDYTAPLHEHQLCRSQRCADHGTGNFTPSIPFFACKLLDTRHTAGWGFTYSVILAFRYSTRNPHCVPEPTPDACESPLDVTAWFLATEKFSNVGHHTPRDTMDHGYRISLPWTALETDICRYTTGKDTHRFPALTMDSHLQLPRQYFQYRSANRNMHQQLGAQH